MAQPFERPNPPLSATTGGDLLSAPSWSAGADDQRARCMDRGNARESPIQTDCADEGGAGELVVVDVVDFQSAGTAVAQQEIGFAGDAAEIADA